MLKTCVVIGALSQLVTCWAFAQAQEEPDPTRLVIECEDMRGVDQEHFGPGRGWQVGRWGQDLYQNMVFGGTWASRLRVAMTDAGDDPAEITADIEVPTGGVYKVWVKYECPPHFNYAFGVKIEPVGAKGPAVFEKTYGLREAAKQFSFKGALVKGDLYWNWGLDHDAAEGYEATLAKGRYTLTVFKTKNPEPQGARSIDAILITRDLSEISTPRMARYPLLDELRRANHVYFRFRNTEGAKQPLVIAWNHGNHRYPDFGAEGTWSVPIEPGASSPWCDLGPTMNTESSSPFEIVARPAGAPPTDPSAPFAVDIALEPSEKKIVKSFRLEPGEKGLAFLVQPDLRRPEGVAYTKKTAEIFAELTRTLNQEPRLGPIPRKLRLFGSTGYPRNTVPLASDPEFEQGMRFREALGLSAVELAGWSFNRNAEAEISWGKRHGGVIERSLAFHHSVDMGNIAQGVKAGGLNKAFYYVSFGDEIGLPAIDGNNTNKVAAFREFIRERGETPESLGLAAWDQVKPLAALSGDVAVQIGVLPEARKADPGSLAGLKKLYWYSLEFRNEQGIAAFAEKTRELKAALGNDAQTSANLGSMHPFYWMHQASFIEAFKGNAMSLAWSEDYTFCQPEASRLVADFQVAYLRKGASYHDTPMQWYCMPHWPGNNPEQVIQNAVLEWGQNVKDLNFYCPSPDIWSTENYVAYRGGLPTLKAIRALSGMAGLMEDHLLPARTEPARVAMLLSEASDVWETEGQGQGAVAPGSIASNVSQEERKAIWYALRYAGYRVDHITEKDCADGLLKNYAAVYVCGQNLERKAAAAVKEWVKAGGTVFATAGAARKDAFDAPLTELDDVLGRGPAVAGERYKGPLRARLELLFVPALDEVKLAEGQSLPVFCSREVFLAATNAQVLATYKDGKPALIANDYGKGRAYYTGALPGQTWAKAALPVLPQGKGGPHTAPHMTEWLGWDPVAAGVILSPLQKAKIEPDVVANRRGVITSRLKSDKSTVITVVNLALEADGELKDVELRVAGAGPVKRAWSCFYAKKNLLRGVENGVAVVKVPTLGPADVVVLEY